MSKYRDMLIKEYSLDIGSAVGCGLDRLGRNVLRYEIDMAIQFYNTNKDKFKNNNTPIGSQREQIKQYIERL